MDGGVGAGTVVRFSLTLARRTNRATAYLDEPEPGRVLREEDPESRMTTLFMLDPVPAGCRMRSETTRRPGPGPAAWIERLLVPRLLGPLDADELALLDAYARTLAGGDGETGSGAPA